MTQRDLSMKQKQTQGHREHICGSQGGWGWGERWNGRLRLADVSYYIWNG